MSYLDLNEKEHWFKIIILQYFIDLFLMIC